MGSVSLLLNKPINLFVLVGEMYMHTESTGLILKCYYKLSSIDGSTSERRWRILGLTNIDNTRDMGRGANKVTL